MIKFALSNFEFITGTVEKNLYVDSKKLRFTNIVSDLIIHKLE